MAYNLDTRPRLAQGLGALLQAIAGKQARQQQYGVQQQQLAQSDPYRQPGPRDYMSIVAEQMKQQQLQNQMATMLGKPELSQQYDPIEMIQRLQEAMASFPARGQVRQPQGFNPMPKRTLPQEELARQNAMNAQIQPGTQPSAQAQVQKNAQLQAYVDEMRKRGLVK